MKHYKIGYTQGVYDMFHIGHLNLINNAKKHCDYLIVGVNSDDLVLHYKHKVPVINESDRCTIIENIKSVDCAVIIDSLDKVEVLKKIHFDAIFIGDDWIDNPRWIKTQNQLAELGVDVVFLPYTQNISSTILRKIEQDAVQEK